MALDDQGGGLVEVFNTVPNLSFLVGDRLLARWTMFRDYHQSLLMLT